MMKSANQYLFDEDFGGGNSPTGQHQSDRYSRLKAEKIAELEANCLMCNTGYDATGVTIDEQRACAN